MQIRMATAVSGSIDRRWHAIMIVVVLFVTMGHTAFAQQVIAPTQDWSNTCNIPGSYQSGQAVCDARAKAINWSTLTFFQTGVGVGTCKDSGGNQLAFPWHAAYCPNGYDPKDYGYSGNMCGWSPPDHFHFDAPNASCVRSGIDPGKNAGSCDKCVGNPINPGTGNKYQLDTDYRSSGAFPLEFIRAYNSIPADTGAQTVDNTGLKAISFLTLGSKWRHSYDRSIVFNSTTTVTTAAAFRPDGKVYYFTLTGTAWLQESDVSDRLERLTDGGGSPTGWRYTTQTDDVEIYDVNGKLLSITTRSGLHQTLTYSDASTPISIAPAAGLLIQVSDDFGHALTFSYDSASRLVSMTDPNGGAYKYAYDTKHNLSSVTYPDSTPLDNTDNPKRVYVYENTTFPNNLTGIVDENNTRFATYSYDGNGLANSSQHAGGADAVSITYGSQTVVTDALNTSRNYGFQTILGVVKNNGVTQPSTTGSGTVTSSTIYDANSNITAKTDLNGNQTTYSYDLSRNLETSRTEAAGTARARTITTQWHATYRLPLLISTYNGGTPILTTSFTYDTSGNQLTRTMTDPVLGTSRTWTYTFNNFGQVLTADGPRTDVNDVTTYTYYTCDTGGACGQLQTVTDALGHVTTYNTYNVAGQPLTITDPNGVVITLTYDARQHLASRTIGTETTAFDYWPTGLLKKVTLPDGSFLSYVYDAAHRLTEIDDADGNRVVYTLDAAGNHTAENLYDPSSALARTHTQVFNSLSQLWKDINAANTAAVTTTLGYDNNGNQTTISAPLTRNTTNQYDELNRLKQVTDPAGGITQYGYDANDHLTSVTDPKGLVTSYQYNGFGDLTQLNSPDTGSTFLVYDLYGQLGNLKQKVDSRGTISVYTFDALNRITLVSYSDQTLSYSYDQGINGKGHLTQLTDGSGSTTYTYTPLGRVASKTQVIGGITKTVGYGYNAAGQLTQVTTPSGQTLVYGYTHNRITSVTVNSTLLLNQVAYSPFGPTTGWHWGNGTLTSRAYDQDGYLTNNSSAGSASYSYYPDGSIQSLNDDAPPLYLSGAGTTTISVNSSSNRLNSSSGALNRSYSHDDAGNITSDGIRSFTYNDAGRMSSATNAGITTVYQHNALGQRVKKSNASGTTYFVYDEAGHLVGEYSSTGSLIQELIYLNDIPVATIRTDQGGSGAGVFYIHTDHLNVPSKITRPSDNAVIWRWDHDAYGNGAPNQDPDGNGLIVTMNLRFSGQYYDAETGLISNGFRDCYDPTTGRYCQPDPIGLDGGSMSLYTYVNDDPINYIDPEGLSRGSGARRRTRDCTSDEWQLCESQCAGKGVRSCKRQQLFMPVRTINRNGTPLTNWIWKDQALSCDCNDPDACKKAIKDAAAALGVSVTTYLIISEGSRLFPPRNALPIP